MSARCEDPASLPFPLPKTLDDIDAAWMTTLLRYRGVIPSDASVISIERQGVGITAGYFSSISKIKCTYSPPQPNAPTNFVAKSWPALELASADQIALMFEKDIKGYSAFTAEEWFPRPDHYLACFDSPRKLFGLVLADAEVGGVHKLHESPLSLEETLKIVPGLARFAARFENCHDESSPMGKRTDYVMKWSSPEFLSTMFNPENKGLPLTEASGLIDKLLAFDAYGGWGKGEPSVSGYCELFAKKFSAFFERTKPENGGSMTLSHGDFRGDNIFLTNANKEGWQCIDFQLMYKGPIPSDLGYLMSTASVTDEVYTEHEDTILHCFYDEFQKHTKAYKKDVYPFEKFKEEYITMLHVIFLYFGAYGAIFFTSSAVDGKVDPSQPDKVTGPIMVAPELGSGAITEESLSPDDIRKRKWWARAFTNMGTLFRRHKCKEFLHTLPDTVLSA
eukprot:m.206321 g.206321  ORF g.206321 m.206321 type:complete len:449 (+) comp23311_c0_seq1:144-1490(+)